MYYDNQVAEWEIVSGGEITGILKLNDFSIHVEITDINQYEDFEIEDDTAFMNLIGAGQKGE